ncbi:IS256 family transposase [Enterococcus cecorum]|uniref:IS256 family transposase n=1 Tax=Enterococcus cecorum TaxID=44008 RepID=UPI001FAB5F65|nr:IS256 family transposase [Enterococcus cecorum]MCJ0567446.1 IS256 family transposase [Enterococcus cecorum]MCJ0595123.1 IS256 family transposase [Enterococcus cecorum]MCJ0596465.1 IS256 family transposase [Enterococcus cecorum]MCJ0601486.1 IS256 family transposase [Enterococcus cecorum]MDZ5560843.1 IS256 family transposase [Enterococcus cecorum]
MIKATKPNQTEVFSMNQFNKEIAQALLENTNLTEVFRNQLESTMNSLLESELTAILGYDPYVRFNNGNYHNGDYTRRLDTQFGQINVRVPRDRKGEFHQSLIPPYTHRIDSLETTIIQLYEKGITTREIADLIEKMYGSHYSPTTISNITKMVDEQVTAFHSRPIFHSQYVCLFLDATYIPLRRDAVQKEAVHIALGITSSGEKEILDYLIAPQESDIAWSELLGSLVSRGLTDVQLIVADGMTAIQNTCERNYPQAKFQRCLVHINRNIMGKVRISDRQEVASDFKKIHHASTTQEGKEMIQTFIDKWQKRYPRMTHSLQETENLLTFTQFPKGFCCEV